MVHEARLEAGLEAIFRCPPTAEQIAEFEDVYQGTVGNIDQRLAATFREAVDSDGAATAREVLSFYQVFYGRQPDEGGLDFWVDARKAGLSLNDMADFFATASEFIALFGNVTPLEQVIAQYRNVLGREPDFGGLTFWSTAVDEGQITLADLGRLFATSPEAQDRFDPFLDAFLLNVANGDQDFDQEMTLFEEVLGNGVVTVDGIELSPVRTMLALNTQAGAEDAGGSGAVGGDGLSSLRLTGDADARIDFTDPDSQLEQLDLDGDGINPGETDFNVRDLIPVSGFEVVDAHARDGALLDPTNAITGYTGDLEFDGTGFDGDGNATDGNIVLGGYGSDTLIGGIGNDFFSAGAGFGDDIRGGRNADFIYHELSTLDAAFTGNSQDLDGGSTFDDDPGQDNDWLLLEASDDEEPVTVSLNESGVTGTGLGTGVASARLGDSATTRDIENLNASGNFYKFLDVTNDGTSISDIDAFRIGAFSDAQGSDAAYARITSVTIPLGSVVLDLTAAQLAGVTNFAQFLAVAKADFELTDGITVSQDTFGGQPIILVEDANFRDRDFNESAVRVRGDFLNTDIQAFQAPRPFFQEGDSTRLFDDVFFGDNRDFSAAAEEHRVPGLSPGATAQLRVNGSEADNTIIGGYDNDIIGNDDNRGDGDDLLFGGDLEFLLTHRHNANLFDADGTISVNADGDGVADDGRDELYGGGGNDGLVWEADGGVYDGGSNGTPTAKAPAGDTLWLTPFSTGRIDAVSRSTDGSESRFLGIDGAGTRATQDLQGAAEAFDEANAAATIVTDGTIRFDLAQYKGYGGADRDGTADQSNYRDGFAPTDIDDIEHIDAGGLGAIDYLAAGTNGVIDSGGNRLDGGLNFENQQNYRAANTDLQLLGTEGMNILRGGFGDDEIEGRENMDTLTGNRGDDTFFETTNNGNNNSNSSNSRYIVKVNGASVIPLDASTDENFVTEALAGNIYFNVHTNTNAGGQIRGQLNQILADTTAGGTQSGVIVLRALLDGGQEVPAGSGGPGSGEGIVTITVAGGAISYTSELLIEGINEGSLRPVAGVSSMHLHNAPAGANGPVILDIVQDAGGDIFGRNVDVNGVAIPGGGDVFTNLGNANGLTTNGDGVDVIERILDLDNNGIADDADGDGMHDVGQDFRAREGDEELSQFEIDPVGVFDNNVGADEWGNFTGVELTINGQFRSIPIGPAVPTRTAAEVKVLLEAALSSAGIAVTVTNDQDSVFLQFENTEGVTAVNAEFLPPGGGFGGYASSVQNVVNEQFEDDELVFRSYQDRADGESVPDLDASLGRDAYANDLVVGFTSEGTVLAEEQEFCLKLTNLKDNDAVSVKVNGVFYSLRVGFNPVTNQNVTGETTQAFTARLIAHINAEIAANPNSRDGDLVASFFRENNDAGKTFDLPNDGNPQNNGVFYLRQNPSMDGEEHVFMNTPMILVNNVSQGEGIGSEVIDISQTSVLLRDYDGRAVNNLSDDPEGAQGLNSGAVAEADRPDPLRFITFEDTSGENRASLQTADGTGSNREDGLEGGEILTFDAVGKGPFDEDLTPLAKDNPLFNEWIRQDDFVPTTVAGLNNPGNGEPSGPLGNGTIGQPKALNAAETALFLDTSGRTFSALHGDDLLIGSKDGEYIDGQTGDDRVIGSRSTDLGLEADFVWGGRNVVISTNGLIIKDAVGDLVQTATAAQGIFKFQDTLVFEQGSMRPDEPAETGRGGLTEGGSQFSANAAFRTAVTGFSSDGGMQGTVLVDENLDLDFADAGIDSRTNFFEFELVRVLSDNGSSLDLSALSGTTFDNNTSVLTTSTNTGMIKGATEFLLSGTADVFIGSDQDERVDGNGAQDVLTGNGGDDTFVFGTTTAGGATTTDSTAALTDQVTDFNDDGDDTLTFGGPAGSSTNYAEGSSANFAAAAVAADAALNGTVRYYADEVGADVYVFYDRNNNSAYDAATDDVVWLTGTTLTEVGFEDIIA